MRRPDRPGSRAGTGGSARCPLRCTIESPARTSRLRMSISISPSLMAGTIGRSIPDARRVMTIDRASSSSGEKGTVRMSSTPRSNAASFVFRSPRRVRPRTGVTLRREACSTAPSRWSSARAVVVVHVDHGQVGVPLGQDRLRLGQGARGPHDEEAVVERELDEVHDQRAIVEHERAAGFVGLSFHVTRRIPLIRDPPFERGLLVYTTSRRAHQRAVGAPDPPLQVAGQADPSASSPRDLTRAASFRACSWAGPHPGRRQGSAGRRP